MVSCVLCQRSEETKITGPLSTKDQEEEEVTAHQNCLLFSSGIYCRDSPEFDDLFGFSVDDVRDEVKRGFKLTCNKCKKRGATAGCEVKRCKKSYHYPCAVEEGAETVEDGDKGKFELYCSKHYQQRQEQTKVVNGHRTFKDPSEPGSSKVYCLTCEKTEGNISLESLSNSITILYCDKHAPRSHKRNMNGDSTGAGPSVYSSDSNSSSSTKHSCSKRRLEYSDKQKGTSSKRKSEPWKRTITDDSSDSDNNGPDSDMAMFAPLESDIDGSANSVLESQTVCQLIRTHTESPTGSPSGNPLQDESKGKIKDDDDETDAESESLLPPVKISMESQSLSTTSATLTAQTLSTACPSVVVQNTEDQWPSPEHSPVHSPDRHIAGPSAPKQTSTRPPSSPARSKPPSVTDSPPCTSSALCPAPPEPICVSLLSSPASPPVLPSDQEPSIDSTSFWKSCNLAGCTQAIFADFMNEMNEVSGRIQSDQASQEDYDLALKVMEASGKLAELVTKQQEELQKKQMELEQATAAMKKAASALRK